MLEVETTPTDSVLFISHSQHKLLGRGKHEILESIFMGGKKKPQNLPATSHKTCWYKKRCIRANSSQKAHLRAEPCPGSITNTTFRNGTRTRAQSPRPRRCHTSLGHQQHPCLPSATPRPTAHTTARHQQIILMPLWGKKGEL